MVLYAPAADLAWLVLAAACSSELSAAPPTPSHSQPRSLRRCRACRWRLSSKRSRVRPSAGRRSMCDIQYRTSTICTSQKSSINIARDNSHFTKIKYVCMRVCARKPLQTGKPLPTGLHFSSLQGTITISNPHQHHPSSTNRVNYPRTFPPRTTRGSAIR